MADIKLMAAISREVLPEALRVAVRVSDERGERIEFRALDPDQAEHIEQGYHALRARASAGR